MKKTTVALLVVVVILVMTIFSAIGSYNSFVSKEESVEKSWAQVENQLQRRADLIPNLINTVKGYMDHEKEVMKNIADARSNLLSADSPSEKAEADSQLTGALGRLLMISENYPDLKANQNFTQLMDELSGTENRIAVARKDYNDEVSVFNKDIKKFPGVIMANMFGFDEREYFKASEGADKAPTVDFGGNN